MPLRRRLTALIVSLLLLPSAASGGGLGCVMPTNGSGNAAATTIGDGHDAHVVGAGDEHRGHPGSATAVSDDADNGSSRGSPHAPIECLSATACAGMALGAPSDLIASALPRGAGVAADIALAPLSPAIGLEPPPPRA